VRQLAQQALAQRHRLSPQVRAWCFGGRGAWWWSGMGKHRSRGVQLSTTHLGAVGSC
jgi:hypothetical protein